MIPKETASASHSSYTGWQIRLASQARSICQVRQASISAARLAL